MPRWILGCLAVVVMLSGTATASFVVAPNEVCIYEHVDYVGWPKCFSLEPGMRHKLVPTLDQIGMNDRTSSIQMGQEVNVIIFEHAHFAGKSVRHDVSVLDLVSPGIRVGSQSNFNDIVSSMIIVPRQTPLSGARLGTGLASFTNMEVFYPLPERLLDYEARYPNLDWMNMNDKAINLLIQGDVEVTLYKDANFEGDRIILPTVGTPGVASFDLSRYQFSENISSLTVKALKGR